jgi:hypothetical protein
MVATPMTVCLPYRVIYLAVFWTCRFRFTSSDTPITAWRDNRGLNQAWFIQPYGTNPDTYTVRNVTGGSYMDLQGGTHFLVAFPSLAHVLPRQARPKAGLQLLVFIKAMHLLKHGSYVSHQMIGTSKLLCRFDLLAYSQVALSLSAWKTTKRRSAK